MKGWLLRQPARSRHPEDITPGRARQRESPPRHGVSYRERPVNRSLTPVPIVLLGLLAMSPVPLRGDAPEAPLNDVPPNMATAAGAMRSPGRSIELCAIPAEGY